MRFINYSNHFSVFSLLILSNDCIKTFAPFTFILFVDFIFVLFIWAYTLGRRESWEGYSLCSYDPYILFVSLSSLSFLSHVDHLLLTLRPDAGRLRNGDCGLWIEGFTFCNGWHTLWDESAIRLMFSVFL